MCRSSALRFTDSTKELSSLSAWSSFIVSRFSKNWFCDFSNLAKTSCIVSSSSLSCWESALHGVSISPTSGVIDSSDSCSERTSVRSFSSDISLTTNSTARLKNKLKSGCLLQNSPILEMYQYVSTTHCYNLK